MARPDRRLWLLLAMAALACVAAVRVPGVFNPVQNPNTRAVTVHLDWQLGGVWFEQPHYRPVLEPGETRWLFWTLAVPSPFIRARACWVGTTECSGPSNEIAVPQPRG